MVTVVDKMLGRWRRSARRSARAGEAHQPVRAIAQSMGDAFARGSMSKLDRCQHGRAIEPARRAADAAATRPAIAEHRERHHDTCVQLFQNFDAAAAGASKRVPNVVPASPASPLSEFLSLRLCNASIFQYAGRALHLLAAFLNTAASPSNGDTPVHDQEIHSPGRCRHLPQRLHDDRSVYGPAKDVEHIGGVIARRWRRRSGGSCRRRFAGRPARNAALIGAGVGACRRRDRQLHGPAGTELVRSPGQRRSR